MPLRFALCRCSVRAVALLVVAVSNLVGGETEITTSSIGQMFASAFPDGKSDIQKITASGDIAVGTVSSQASLVTVSGDLGVERAEASLTARAVSGDVTIGSASGALGISTTSGDVDVKSVTGGDVRVQTVSGDVRIGVARGTRTWIDAASVSGRLESELGLEDQEPAADTGDAVVPLHVKTVSGDVSIVRVRSPFLFEIGEELAVRIEHDGVVSDATARVRAHVGPDDARITELEISDRSEPRVVSG